MLIVGALGACGGASAPAAPTPTSGPAGGLDAPRAGSDDVIVATVDGHPVWASCLQAQAARAPTTRDQALRDCVDVEVLARAADRRGLATDRDVVLATRTALVSRLVETAFEDRVRTVADLPAAMLAERAFGEERWRMPRPEVRSSGYVRVVVAATEPAGGPIDTAAHALADQIAAAAAPQTGWFETDLVDLEDRTRGRRRRKLKLELAHADVAAMSPPELEKNYADALYAIPAIGQTSPAVRTKWGWDVIVWTDVLPPLETSRDQLLAQMFPDLRRAYFAQWVSELARGLGVHLERQDKNLGVLDQLDEPAGMP